MRERLTASFVILTLALLLGAGAVRAFTLQGLIREDANAQLYQEARLLSKIVTEHQSGGSEINEGFLSRYVSPDGRVEYVADGQSEPVVVRGDEYGSSNDPGEDLSVSYPTGEGRLTLSESPDRIGMILGGNLWSLVILFAMSAGLAGLAGFVISRLLSAPFRQLAVAAAALGRGRFDLDLPRTRIPEARAIGQALRSSADQLKGRLQREQEFAEHASHALRSPLTGLRLELEDLTLRDDLPEDVKETALRCVAEVETINLVAGELVELSRRGRLVEGAAIALKDLASECAQHWADELREHDRRFTAAVEGDLEGTYTPGPIEQALDLLLDDIVIRGTGAVRLVFDGDKAGHLRVRVSSKGETSPSLPTTSESGSRVEQARAVIEGMGGRLQGDAFAAGLEILLPRR